MAELTPMMRQYMDVKEQNPDSLLFFRLGDFYEMFGADARTASQELDLAHRIDFLSKKAENGRCFQ